MKQVTVILFFLVCSMLVGCSDSTSTRKEEANKKNVSSSSTGKVDTVAGAFSALPNSAVLISVNGKALTKEMFLKWVELRVVMGKVAQGQMPNDELKSLIRDQMLSSVTNDYISQVIASEYAKTVGLMAGTNQISRCKKGFSYACRMPNAKWEKVIGRFPKNLQEVIEDRVHNESILSTVFTKFVDDNHVTVEQSEIDKLYNNYINYNNVCAQTNLMTWVTASNIWQRVRNGEDFKELARQFDEDKYRESDGVWGTFQLSDFTDEPEIWRLTPKFRLGWVSPPIEADNGLMIMKIDAIEDGGNNVKADDYVPSPSAVFTISRIFLHLPLFAESLDKDTFAREVIQAKRNVEFQKFIDELKSKSNIAFPSGTEIFGSSKPNDLKTGM